jgi:hypothetical protein
MEMLLIAITIVSLIVAFVMSAATWRVGREERTRSAARVAALAAAANDEARPIIASDVRQVAANEIRARMTDDITHGFASEIRPAIAGDVRPAVAEPVAVNDSRPWAPARVSTFSPRPAVIDDLPLSTAPFGDTFLGAAVATPASGGRQRGLAIAAMFLFVLVSAGGYWTVFGDKSTAVSAAATVGTQSPLELVSLRHERRGPRLAVTGLVRNPGAGTPVEKLAAVVFLFDQQGGFLTSARAEVDYTRLVPGDESPFVISVEAPANVGRYRVSFRNDAGVVPHIDRRGQEPIAAAGAER